jgi:hypothetical protein
MTTQVYGRRASVSSLVALGLVAAWCLSAVVFAVPGFLVFHSPSRWAWLALIALLAWAAGLNVALAALIVGVVAIGRQWRRLGLFAGLLVGGIVACNLLAFVGLDPRTTDQPIGTDRWVRALGTCVLTVLVLLGSAALLGVAAKARDNVEA